LQPRLDSVALIFTGNILDQRQRDAEYR